MSDKLNEQAKRLPFSKVNTEQLRAIIAKNLHRLESELDGYDWIALWDAPRLLGIKDDDLVFLLLCRLVPSPELFDGGLYFYRPSFLASLCRVADTARPLAYIACAADGSLETSDDGERTMNTVNSSQLSRHELKYLQELRQRIGANLSELRGGGFYTTATRISQTVVHGSPRTPNQPGGVLNISANDFKLLVSAGVVSPSVRVEHSRGSYYLDMLVEELEHFTGYDDGTN